MQQLKVNGSHMSLNASVKTKQKGKANLWEEAHFKNIICFSSCTAKFKSLQEINNETAQDVICPGKVTTKVHTHNSQGEC